ncbi:nitroreductase family deazaflavin-dependent oxidoreductase [soil metagenome]
MPLPMRLARFNRSFTNRIIARFAGRLPPLAIIHHVGRKSGKSYVTPIVVFRRADIFVIVMTYGIETEWSKNVLAAKGCAIEYRGKQIALTEPRLTSFAEFRDQMPALVRFILKRINAHDAMVLSASANKENRVP